MNYEKTNKAHLEGSTELDWSGRRLHERSAIVEEEHALELRTRDRERKLLTKVQASLRQIDEGSYGYCLDTGEPIGIKRLLARPTATLSVEAQERREQLKKQFAG
ncbi:MAG: hypothetical protein DI619_05655 [Francisella sp.]|nr:MAG: hypothetical protein DI619_05655 [Francisella sp.]